MRLTSTAAIGRWILPTIVTSLIVITLPSAAASEAHSPQHRSSARPKRRWVPRRPTGKAETITCPSREPLRRAGFVRQLRPPPGLNGRGIPIVVWSVANPPGAAKSSLD